MANTFTSLHYHIVFSTKHRKPRLTAGFDDRIWSYLGGIAKQNHLHPLAIGGIEDHVHMLLGVPPTIAVSDAVRAVKGGSSKWIHETFESLAEFSWQDGYGAFTVSRSQIEATELYIRNQREHHRERSFCDEYLALLRKHGIEFDERFVFD